MFMGLLRVAACISLILVSASLAWGQTPRYVEGELIVKLRETPEERIARREGRAFQDVASRRQLLQDRFGLQQVRAVQGLARTLSPSHRERLATRMAKAGRPPVDVAEQALAEFSRVFVVELPEGQDVEQAAAALRTDPAVEYAHPNYIAEAFFTPDDPFWSTAGSWGQVEDDLWGLELLETEQAWDVTQGQGVVVAILDSGVDFGHPDLAANAWVNPGHGSFPAEVPGNGVDDDDNGYIDDVNGFDFTRSVDANGDGDYNDPEDTSVPEPIDEHGHGTHVAGTVAAVGNNAQGIIGVAPQVQIMGVRGLDVAGSGTFENLAAGLVYAALNGADVINNSWGCAYCPSAPILEDAVRLAHDLDVVVVFAAANSNDNVVHRSPQNMAETIVVSALTPTDEKTSFSSFGPLVDVGAPGGGVEQPGVVNGVYNILSLQTPGSTLDTQYPGLVVAPGYLRLAGTSMASPHAAGVAALLRAHDPTLRNEQVRQILRLASDPVVTSGLSIGYGRVNARKVLESTLNVELLIETPTVESRLLGEPVEVAGYARGTNLQNVQVSVGAGYEPSAFVAMPTTWNPVTGALTATVDVSQMPDGFALLRLEADDGLQTYASAAGIVVDNIKILAPTANEVVEGQIDVVVDVGTSPYLERVVVTYFNHFTNQTEVLLDTTTISGPVLTIPFDTTASIDSTELIAIHPTITVESHFDVNGDPLVTSESVVFQIDNDRITSPSRAWLTTDPSPFLVEGSALHDVQLQVHDGSGWLTAASLSAGSFSVPVDPAALVDLDARNLVVLRLVADVDGNAVFSDAEQNELVHVFVDTALAPGWPQSVTERSLNLKVTVGDLDGNGLDEVIALPDGTSFNLPSGELIDPNTSVLVYDGNGTLNAAVATGSQQFHAPRCGTQAALHDLDGLPGMELIWSSWGQIAALRHDGTPPAGFDPDIFNDGDFDLFAHQNTDYTELYPCRPTSVFTTNEGDLRILQSTRLFDWSGPKFAGIIPSQLLESKLLLFDATGTVVNEVDRGPGRSTAVVWSIGEIDVVSPADLMPEIVTTRSEIVGPNGEIDGTLLVYDALTLGLELELTLSQVTLGTPVLSNLDGDANLEIVVPAIQYPPVGQTGGLSAILLAFQHDGEPVPGFSHSASELGAMAAADLDSDGSAEIVLSQKNAQNEWELVLLTYDPVAEQLQMAPNWPVATPGPVGTILFADIDGDGAQEVVYDSSEPWTHTVASTSSKIFDRYFVSALEQDGTPWQAGWERSLRGLPSMAIGNLDSDGGAELALAYPVGWVSTGNPEAYQPEVLVYPLGASASPVRTPWSHRYGNAQQSGATRTQCQDGADNDEDGQIDAIDPQCTGPLDPHEACGIGPELLVILPPLYWLSRRRQSRMQA